ncbi:MAG: tRNA lysidine(34) synthetase TilS, partial [Bdellovibrionales bacterium]
SMALAYCLKRWTKRQCVALVVEHGLRDESAAEAKTVKKRLQKMGFETEILPWKHGAVSGKLHEKARSARYGLLTEACRRLGANDLLLAHHRGDQAETILMRLAKGSGIDGLAGIPEQAERDGIRLLRPFLSLPKERLIATCREAKMAFVMDPSNGSEKYARGRLRKIMPLLASEGLTIDNLTVLGARAKEAKAALDHATREFIKKSAKTGAGGSVRFDRAALCAVPREIAIRALVAGLRYVHDGDYPPEYASLSGLMDAIEEKKHEGARTLYGCIASIAEKKVTLLREPSAATETLSLLPGSSVLWDGRWLVSASPKAKPVTVRALGSLPHDLLDSLAPDLRRRIPEGRIRACLPALWDGEKHRAIPSFDKKPPFWAVYVKRAIS